MLHQKAPVTALFTACLATILALLGCSLTSSLVASSIAGLALLGLSYLRKSFKSATTILEPGPGGCSVTVKRVDQKQICEASFLGKAHTSPAKNIQNCSTPNIHDIKQALTFKNIGPSPMTTPVKKLSKSVVRLQNSHRSNAWPLNSTPIERKSVLMEPNLPVMKSIINSPQSSPYSVKRSALDKDFSPPVVSKNKKPKVAPVLKPEGRALRVPAIYVVHKKAENILKSKGSKRFLENTDNANDSKRRNKEDGEDDKPQKRKLLSIVHITGKKHKVPTINSPTKFSRNTDLVVTNDDLEEDRRRNEERVRKLLTHKDDKEKEKNAAVGQIKPPLSDLNTEPDSGETSKNLPAPNLPAPNINANKDSGKDNDAVSALKSLPTFSFGSTATSTNAAAAPLPSLVEEPIASLPVLKQEPKDVASSSISSFSFPTLATPNSSTTTTASIDQPIFTISTKESTIASTSAPITEHTPAFTPKSGTTAQLQKSLFGATPTISTSDKAPAVKPTFSFATGASDSPKLADPPKPVLFGSPAVSTGTSTPSLSFGSALSQCEIKKETPEPAKPAFSLGSTLTPTTNLFSAATPTSSASSFALSTAPSTPSFNFGSTVAKPSATTSLPSFAASLTSTGAKLEPSSTTTTFGASSSATPSFATTAATTVSSTPSFFAAASDSTAPTASFSFGSPSIATTNNPVKNADKTTFSFGSGATPAFGASSNPSATFGSTPTFQSSSSATPFFGSNTTSITSTFAAPSTSTTGFSFGSSNTAKPTETTGTFSFGGTTTPAFGGTSSATPGFGGTTSSTPAFGGTTSSTPAFGGTTSSTPAFGGASLTTPAFGGASSTTPAFGGASSTTPAFCTSSAPTFGAASSTSNTFSFGGTSSSTPSSTPAFGSTTNPAFGASSTTPAFGATSSTAPTFGTAPSTTGTFTFGGAPSSTPAVPFGGAPSSTPAVPTSGFSFGGAATATPSTGAFNFSAAAATSTPTPAASNMFSSSPATPSTGRRIATPRRRKVR